MSNYVKPFIKDNYYNDGENNEYTFTNRNFTFINNNLDKEVKYIYDYSNGSSILSNYIYNGDPAENNNYNNYLYDQDTDTWYYRDDNYDEITTTQEDEDISITINPSSGGGSGSNNDGGCVLNKMIAVNTNITPTYISISYIRKDNSEVSFTKTVTIKNQNIIIATDNSLEEGETINYSAIIYEYDEENPNSEILEEINGSINISASSNIIKLRFTKKPRSKYYFKINNSEEKYVNDYINSNAQRVNVTFETNFEEPFELYVYTQYDSQYGSFKINDNLITKKTYIKGCTRSVTLNIDIDALDYTPTIEDFGPRAEDVYSINKYQYSKNGLANSDRIRRIIKIIPLYSSSIGYNEIGYREYSLIQRCDFLLEENQVVELDMSDKIRNGYLCGNGGSCTFRIKAKCWWYMRSVEPYGFGIPNQLTFSQAEGGPCDWTEITMSWGKIGNLACPKFVEFSIHSITSDEVICEKKWNGANYLTHKFTCIGYGLKDDPRGRNLFSVNDQLWAEYCPVLKVIRFGSPNSLWGNKIEYDSQSFSREAQECYLFIKTRVNYRVKEHESWFHHQLVYSPYGEGNVGPQLYLITVDENTTGSKRTGKFEVEIIDSRYSGSDWCDLIQEENYNGNKNPDNEEYGFIKQRNIVIPKPNYNNGFTINVFSNEKFVLGDYSSRYGEYATMLEENYNTNNPHPASNFGSIIVKSDDGAIALFIYSNYLREHYYSVYYVQRDSTFGFVLGDSYLKQRYIIGGE